MTAAAWPGSLAQRACVALNQALLRDQPPNSVLPNERVHRLGDLLIDGLSENHLPRSVARTRPRSPDSATLLAINTFLPWQREADTLPLAGWLGFQEMRFQVRCPTGLRGTPPHLHVFTLREDMVLAVTVRCCEYLTRRRSPVSESYDRLLATTPGAVTVGEG